MSNKRTATDTRPYATVETSTSHTPQSAAVRSRPAEELRYAGEHPAFDPGFIDVNRTIWFTVPSDRPACVCGLPARRDRLTCGSHVCMGAL